MSDIITERDRFAAGWRGGLPETPCGHGSKLNSTIAQREWLPVMFRKYGVRSVCDIGAGDLNWIHHMPMKGISYRALDLVPRRPDVEPFDLVREIPPQADMLLCLWVLNHMPYADCQAAIANLRASGSRWLVMTDRPSWHHEQPPEIRMTPLEELPLDRLTGDRIILVDLEAA